MPKEFDKMRLEIKKKLKSDGVSEEDAEKRSYAIATAQWKKSHGGKAPESIKLEYSIPITFKESIFGEEKDFTINGVAISETTTLNNHRYIAEELEKATNSLINKPLLVDHDAKVANIKGKVTSALWNSQDKRIDFEAKVTDDQIKEMIKKGVLSTVSVGAYAKELEESDEGLIAKGINFVELSFVPCPADQNATFVMAMCEAFELQEQKMKCPECGYEGEMKDMDEAMHSDAEIRKMMKKQHPDWSDEEIEKAIKKKNHESQSTIQVVLKGGRMETITEDQKVIEELNCLKKTVEEYKMKERKALEESYTKLCQEKKVKSLDISKMSNEAIEMLKEQISSIKIEEKQIEEKEASDGFIIEKTGKGFALWK